MSFPVYLYGAVFIAAFALAFASSPIFRMWCVRTNLVDDPGHRKIHHTPIPLSGGLAVFAALLFTVAAGYVLLRAGVFTADITDRLLYGFGKRGLQLTGIALGAFGMGLLGLADDKWELKPMAKLLGQIGTALLVAACDVRVTLFVPSTLFSYVITVLWIVGVINAFNFMDNMNGLCSGLGAIAAIQFGLVAAWNGQYLVALLSFAVAGALCGFLPFNYPRATAFLGDAGSHLVGYLMAISAILPTFYSSGHGQPIAVLTPFLILAVPLADMAYVSYLRTRAGKPFYVGDTNHLSHRLVRRGLSPQRAVALIWGIAAAIGALAFLLAGTSNLLPA